MKNKLLSLCFIAFLGLFSFINSCFAIGTYTDQRSGVTVEEIDSGHWFGKKVVWFDGYSFGTQTVTNNNGSTTIGLLEVANLGSRIGVHVDVSSVPANGTLTLNVRGALGTTGSSAILTTRTYGAATTSVFFIDEVGIDWLSLTGASSTSTASTIASVIVEAKTKKEN